MLIRFLVISKLGVGQTEMDVAQAADSVVVVLSPESGDAIQAMKAGLMEVADILVVNHALLLSDLALRHQTQNY